MAQEAEQDDTGVKQQKAQWDESIVMEYEARVEPFTELFVKDLLEPILSSSRKSNNNKSYLLDVGCGCGCATLLALKAGFNVTATDVSEGMVERTRQRAKEKGFSVGSSSSPSSLGQQQQLLQCLVADGQALSSIPEITKTTYDFAVAGFSVIFFPSPAKGLAEIYRCLKSGGKVLLTAWGGSEETPAFRVFPDAFQAITPESSDKRKPNRISGSPDLLRSLLEEANFHDIEIVGPVSHNLQVSSPLAFYDRFALTSPKVRGDLEALDDIKRQAVKAKVMELATERGGQPDGSISIPSMAFLAYGTKKTQIVS